MSMWRMEESREMRRQAEAADRLLGWVALAFAAVTFAVSVATGSLGVGLLVVLPTVAIGAWLVRAHAGALPTRLFMGSAFMVLAATLIHEGDGLIELHFAIFVMLAFLVIYRDWRPMTGSSSCTSRSS